MKNILKGTSNLCDIKYRFLIIAIRFGLHVVCFVCFLLYTFNMYNKEIFALITCSSVTDFHNAVIICVFECAGHISSVFTDELLHSGS